MARSPTDVRYFINGSDFEIYIDKMLAIILIINCRNSILKHVDDDQTNV